MIYGAIVVHRVRKGFFNSDSGHGPVNYEAEDGYKMAASPVPVNSQYR